MPKQLYLHEELMLLALREEAGTVASSGMIDYALAAAILSELLIRKKIEIDPLKKKKGIVNLIDSAPLDDPLLDEALQKLNAAKRRASLKTWVQRLARIKKFKHRIAIQLYRRGILRADEDKVLFVFTRKIYPEIDPRPERELVERLRTAIFTDRTDIPPRDTIIIALAHHMRLLRQKFDKKDLKTRKARIKQIAEGSVTAKAAKEVMDAVTAAIMVAVIIPTVISTSS